MQYIGYIVTIINILLIYYFFKKESKKFFILTPFLLFVIFEVVFVWPTAIFGHPIARHHDGWFLLVISISFLFFIAGFSIYHKNLYLPNAFLQKKTVYSFTQQQINKKIIYIGFFLIMIGMLLYQGIPPGIKLPYELLSGNLDIDDAIGLSSSSRYELTKAAWFGGQYRGQGILREFMRIGWPFLVIITLGMYSINKKKKTRFILFLFFFLTYVFVAGTGSRAPLIYSFIAIFTSYTLIKPLRTTNVVKFGVIVFLLLLVMTLASSKGLTTIESGDSVSNVSNALIERLFFANGKHNLATVDFLRDGALEYRFGALHFQTLVSSIPGVRYGTPFSYELWQLLHPGAIGTTFSSGTYFMDVYLDFGFFGSIIVYFLMGMMIGKSYQIIYPIHKPKSLYRLASSGLLTLYFGKLSGSGPVGIISSLIVLYTIQIIFKLSLKKREKCFQ